MSDVRDVNEAVSKKILCSCCGAHDISEYAVVNGDLYCWLCFWAKTGILI